MEVPEAQVTEQRGLAERLCAAIEREELTLVVRPRVDVGLRSLTGAEAQLRWRHPEHGLLSPRAFLGRSEPAGLVNRIGAWALRRACAEARSWPAARRLSVAVNVPLRRLAQRDFPQEVGQVLAETGLEPERLELELSGGSLRPDETARTAVAALRAVGVHVALDGFDAGTSSLAWLRAMRFDTLKLHPACVQAGAQGGVEEAIAAALVDIARTLGIRPLGDGVETREQMQFLYRKGCSQMQGDLFGKPMACEEFAELAAADVWPWQGEAADARF